MKEKNTPQKNNEHLKEILGEISSRPDEQVVASSFDKVMKTVTDSEFTRIPSTAEVSSNASVGMPKFMSNIQKIFTVSVPALAIVILVGYNTIAQDSVRQYEDIILAAVEGEGAYEYEEYTEDYEDLFEESLLEENTEIISGQNLTSQTDPQASSQPQQEQSGTESIPANTDEQVLQTKETLEETLSVIDNIFAEDDIDDSELNAWFADESATDALFENYDI